MKSRKRTAAELMAELSKDPQFVAKRSSRDAARRARESELHRAQADLLRDLKGHGVAVGSVWELVNSASSYPSAIETLLSHLGRSYPSSVREGIARALAVGDARWCWSALVQAYHDEHDSRVKEGIAVALAAIADEEVLDDVLCLVNDGSLGSSRALLLTSLERMRDPRALKALVESKDDPDLTREAHHILARRRARRDGD